MGMRVDYLSPTLYLVDVVWGLWMMTKLRIKKPKLTFENMLVMLFVVMNVLVAENKWVAIYKWLRIGQWVVTFKIIKNSKLKINNLLKGIIPVWIVVESLLGLAQVVKGGSLQGIFYWLGERSFDFSGIGVAQLSVAGNGLVRAYGTFSHPNSLAGFLLVCLIWWSKYKKNLWWWVVFWLGVVGILVTGSRTVWVLGITAILVNSYKLIVNSWKKYTGFCLVFTGFTMIVLGIIGANYRISEFVSGWDSDSLAKRVNLNMVGMKMWQENFFLGVGVGNFIVRLPDYQNQSGFYWWQPIHNIFLLTGVEMGMLGVVLITKFLIFNLEFLIKRKNYFILGVILMTGMLDHYWITLPQNSWLLAVVLALL